MKQSLVDRVAEVAQADPARSAFIFDGEPDVSYAELLRRATPAASKLQAISQGKRVIVVTDLDSFGPVLVLAAAIAGVQICPIDAQEKPGRIATICRTVDAQVLASPFTSEVLATAGVEHQIWDGTDEDVSFEPSGGDLDIVTFTSGSTSAPKALAVPIGRWHQRDRIMAAVGQTGGRRLLIASPGSYGYAVGVVDGLMLGATTALYDVRQNSVTALLEFVTTQRITNLSITPTLAREMARRQADAQAITTMRQVEVRGERVTGDDLLAITAVFPEAEIQHLYGSAEVGRISTWHWYPGQPVPEGGLPAGTIEPGLQTRIVDRKSSTVTPFVESMTGEGELLTLGPAQFTGYLSDQQATDAKMAIIDDHGWVRTGDLVRIDDGELEILGRIDHQVKIGGQFVDLQDLAFQIESLPNVAQTVITQLATSGSLQLVAHLVAMVGQSIDPIALRADLATRFPVYMVPSHVRVLREPPMNASGKLDRQHLGQWRPDGVHGQGAEPDGSAEERIAQQAAALLSLDELSRDDDLVTLGMESLGWIELIDFVESAYGVEIDLARVFEQPTVAGVSALIQKQRAGTLPGLTTLSEGERQPTFIWLGNGYRLHRTIPSALASQGYSSYGVVPLGQNGAADSLTRVTDIGDYAIRLINDQSIDGPLVLCGFSASCLHAHYVATQLRQQGRDIPLLLLLDPPRIRRWRLFHRRDAKAVIRMMRFHHRQWTFRRLARKEASLFAAGNPTGAGLIDRSQALSRAQHSEVFRHAYAPYDGTLLVLDSRLTDKQVRFDDTLVGGRLVQHFVDVEHADLPFASDVVCELIGRCLGAESVSPDRQPEDTD